MSLKDHFHWLIDRRHTRDRFEIDMDEELRFHIESQIEDSIKTGVSPEEARRAVLLAFGGMDKTKEECRDAGRIRWLDECRQDLRYAARILAKSPGFTILAVLMLALGIGANTAIVSSIDAIVFRPMPFGNINRLVTINPGSNFAHYLDIRADDSVFSGVAAYMGLPLAARSTIGDMLTGRAVSANFFQVLGLNLTLGRGFLPEEEALSGSLPVVVISHDFWGRTFSRDPAVLGKSLRLNGDSFTIVGVAPKGFRDAAFDGSQDLWVPIPMFARMMHMEKEPAWREALERRDMYVWLSLIARLKPATTLEQARARLKVLTQNLEKNYPGSTKNWNPTLTPANSNRWPEGSVRYFSVILLAAALCILLITCTNIANLLLARGSTRQREIATRLAIGASRGRIVRQLLAEGMVLSFLGLILSLAVYKWTIGALPAFEDSFGSKLSLGIGTDRRAFFFAICIAVLTNLMFGLAPAMISSRTDLSGALKNQGFLGFRRGRIVCRRALVVFQMALTVILLVGAGLFIRTIWHFSSIDPGFDRNVLLVGTSFFESGGFEIGTAVADTRAALFYQQALMKIRELPGIRSAAWAEDLPYNQRGYIEARICPEERSENDAEWLSIHCNVVSSGYFKTLGIPILQGRDFGDSDYRNPTGLMIVNETLARRFWPGQSPIGKYIRVKGGQPALREVVGVAKDLRLQNPWDNVRPYVYGPYWQFPLYFHMDLHASVEDEAARAIGLICKACDSVDPKVTINNPRLIWQEMTTLLSQERSTAIVLSAFGSLALVLAAIGLYGIISYSVTQRTREFGIRAALGAQRADILRQVILEGMVLVSVGLVIGLPCSAALSRLVAGRMHGLKLLDPAVYTLVSLLSFAIALFAVMIPARRAARPIDALRVE